MRSFFSFALSLTLVSHTFSTTGFAQGRRPEAPLDSHAQSSSPARAWTVFGHSMALAYQLPKEKNSVVHWSEWFHHSVEAATLLTTVGGEAPAYLLAFESASALGGTLINLVAIDRRKPTAWTDLLYHVAHSAAELPELLGHGRPVLEKLSEMGTLWVPLLSLAHSLALMTTLSHAFQSPEFYTELFQHWTIVAEGKEALQKLLGSSIDAGLVTFLFAIAAMIGVTNRPKDEALDAPPEPVSASGVLLEQLAELQSVDHAATLPISHRALVKPAITRKTDHRLMELLTKRSNALPLPRYVTGHRYALSPQAPGGNYVPFLSADGKPTDKSLQRLEEQDRLKEIPSSLPFEALRSLAPTKDIRWQR